MEGTTDARLGSATNIESNGTNVKVEANHVGAAHANATGGSGGLIFSGADLEANGTDSPKVTAFLESGAVVGSSKAKPNSLAVTATSTEGTSVAAEGGGGGLVAQGGMKAISTLDPEVAAYLAGANTIALLGELTVHALLKHAEGHSVASAYGGGAAQIGATHASSTVEPRVLAYAGSGSTINVAGNVSINAESLAESTGKPLTDNFEANSTGVNQSTGEVEFTESGLSTGDAVLYVDDGHLLPGMRQNCEFAADGGCIYNVIVVNGNHLKFGNQFVTTAVNTTELPGCSDAARASTRTAT